MSLDWSHLGRPVRLGKKPPKVDKRTLRLASYVNTEELPPPPASVNWAAKMSRPRMYRNGEIGCCGFAALGHLDAGWTAANGSEIVIPEEAILRAYRDVGGWVDGDPSTDNGIVMLDGCNYFRKTGIGGRKALAFLALDLANREHLKQAIYRFGGVYAGFSLPDTSKRQARWHIALGGTEQGGVNNDANQGSFGGHAVAIHGYDETGVLLSTWDVFLWASWSFVDVYMDEGYVFVSRDWADGDGSPSGMDVAALNADLSRLA
jgi:hypothetical protein